MNLAAKYNRANLAASIIVLFISGIIYYAVIHYIFINRLDKDLTVEEDEIIQFVNTYHQLPLPVTSTDLSIKYSLVKNNIPVKRTFIDDEYQDGKENEPGRSLITSLRFNNRFYRIVITESKAESEDLIRVIFFFTVLIIGLLLLSIILINRLVLNRLWLPFYSILSQMKAFSITEKNEISQEETSIDEFKELNQAAIAMSVRVKRDYKILKNYVDNASHEMMTPLAIINSKLDSLLQTRSFTREQGELLEDVYNAVGRLSRLNHSFLLSAKIENQLMQDQEILDISSLIADKLKQFQELIQGRNLTTSSKLENKEILVSKYLMDVLLNNLISNAIRHNTDGGNIEIVLTSGKLSIANTGIMAPLYPEKVFERFYKGTGSEGMGLGLAISKQICTVYSFDLSYSYRDDRHTFLIRFE